MTDYVKNTNFTTKDSLTSGDPQKIIRGSELDDEFNEIQIAVNSKIDENSPTFTGTPRAPTPSTAEDSTRIATTEFVQAVKEVVKQEVYPVGCLYLSISDTDPATTLGFGTWTAYAQGEALVGVGGSGPFTTVGTSFGISDALLPSHQHDLDDGGSRITSIVTSDTVGTSSVTIPQTGQSQPLNIGPTGSGKSIYFSSDIDPNSKTEATGAAATNANYQPSVSVYVWRRVS